MDDQSRAESTKFGQPVRIVAQAIGQQFGDLCLEFGTWSYPLHLAWHSLSLCLELTAIGAYASSFFQQCRDAIEQLACLRPETTTSVIFASLTASESCDPRPQL